MSCRCKEKRRSLDYTRKLATIFAKRTNEEVQIFSYLDNNEIFYNFEILNKDRKNIIEYIRP